MFRQELPAVPAAVEEAIVNATPRGSSLIVQRAFGLIMAGNTHVARVVALLDPLLRKIDAASPGTAALSQLVLLLALALLPKRRSWYPVILAFCLENFNFSCWPCS